MVGGQQKQGLTPFALLRWRRTRRKGASSDWRLLGEMAQAPSPDSSPLHGLLFHWPLSCQERFPLFTIGIVVGDENTEGERESLCPSHARLCEEVKGKLDSQGVPRACNMLGVGGHFSGNAAVGVLLARKGVKMHRSCYGSQELILSKGKVSAGCISTGLLFEVTVTSCQGSGVASPACHSS